MELRNDLLLGKKKIGVWGAGFIGATTAMAYAAEGVSVLCYDISDEAVHGINLGRVEVTNLEFWFGATMEEFVQRGLVRATFNWEDMNDPDIVCHFIAVPTEAEGKPWDGALLDVLNKLKTIKPRLVVVESTLVPGKLDLLKLDDLRIGIAPRRDWFHSPEKNLKNLDRVFGGPSQEIADDMEQVLSIVCDNLQRASNHRVAEIVKSVENSLLHIPAVYANQLTHAYPNLDVGEILKLASTHWRIPLYYPSMGIGGYCIPVSSQYVIDGADKPETLTILKEVVDWDAQEPYFTAELVADQVGTGSVGVMGISYKGDLKVHILSPTLRIVERLKEKEGITVRVNDPYYSAEEIRAILDVPEFDLNSELGQFDALVVVTDHKAYSRIPLSYLLGNLKPGALVLDNYGIWKGHAAHLADAGIRYYKVGDKGWTLGND